MIERARRALKVEREADPQTVRQAYVRLVRRYPPEHFPEKFADLRRAYQQLTLDDDFIEENFSKMMDDPDALTLAGFMWGDREELDSGERVSLMSLLAFLKGEEVRDSLDQALTKAASEEIVLRL
ncbi:MAG: hypothetical protein LBQ90_02715 [Synergistaceae bacterium]|jgi:hypothetical protein|nr:hypothetical protein [Synergistaceae bacterium]